MPTRVTRVMLHAILHGPRDVLAVVDGQIRALRADQILGQAVATGSVRILVTRSMLHDAGAVADPSGRLMSGSGPILDRVVAELTEADCG